MGRVLLGVGVAALAACTAITQQPGQFSLRQWAAMLVVGAAALGCALRPRCAGVAWPLLAGLALPSLYRMAYDPVLPDAILSRLPMRVAILEPTTPMVVASVLIAAWALSALWRRRRADEGALLALRSILLAAQGLMLVAILLYLLLGQVYDLESGIIFWKFTLACWLYLGLTWVGVEAAATGLMGWPEAALILAGLGVSLARNLGGGGGQ